MTLRRKQTKSIRYDYISFSVFNIHPWHYSAMMKGVYQSSVVLPVKAFHIKGTKKKTTEQEEGAGRQEKKVILMFTIAARPEQATLALKKLRR